MRPRELAVHRRHRVVGEELALKGDPHALAPSGGGRRASQDVDVLPSVGLVPRADNAQPEVGQCDVQRLQRPRPLCPRFEPEGAVSHRGVARVERAHDEQPVGCQQRRAGAQRRDAFVAVHRFDDEREVDAVETLT